MTVDEALITLDTALKQKRLTDIQELVFRQAWEGRTYLEIAQNFGYDPDYIKYVGFQLWQLLSSTFGEKVTKSNFQSVLSWRKRAERDGGEENQGKSVPTASLSKPSSPVPLPWTNLHQDWGEAIDVSVFYGRTEELTTLKQWIVPDAPAKIFPEPCRLVVLLGMGGIGKTVLAVKLARQLVAEPGDRKATETRCTGNSASRPNRDTGNFQNPSPPSPPLPTSFPVPHLAITPQCPTA